MSIYKFSGHETFQCRHFWIKKGVDFIVKSGDFKSNDALVELGVGKNMVASMNYWLRAFGVVNVEGRITGFGELFFLENGYDPFIEDVGTQYLLHFNLVRNSSFASIYKMVFEDFRKTRVDSEFTVLQLFEFVMRTLVREGVVVSEKTVQSDIRVFLKTYFSGSKKGSKSIEDDFASILIGLGFIDRVEGVLVDGDVLYRINLSDQKSLDERLFLFMILEHFEGQDSISVDQIQIEISDRILCNREGTEDKLSKLMNQGLLIYKQDAGRKEVQLKVAKDKLNLLSKYYGRV